jgi:hypothetical protein
MMSNHDDDLVSRAFASADQEAAEGAKRRRARFEASLAAIQADPGERARIDSIAAEAGIADQDEAVFAGGGEMADALSPGIDVSLITEVRNTREQVDLILQDTLAMQDKLIAQGEKMRKAMEELEEHAAAAEEGRHRRRSRGTTLSQITMPVIVVALIGVTQLMAIRPSGVAATVALTFAGTVVLYSAAYVTAFLMSAWHTMRGNGQAEQVLRLLMGSLSVEERLAEARASAVSPALRNTSPDNDLTLEVGTRENRDVIRLTRTAASDRPTKRRSANSGRARRGKIPAPPKEMRLPRNRA